MDTTSGPKITYHCWLHEEFVLREGLCVDRLSYRVVREERVKLEVMGAKEKVESEGKRAGTTLNVNKFPDVLILMLMKQYCLIA